MIVMKPTATEQEIQGVIDRIEAAGARAHPSRGDELTVIGAIGDLEREVHVAVLGLDDVVVVDTPDAVLVTTRSRAQDVKAVVDALRAAGRTDLL